MDHTGTWREVSSQTRRSTRSTSTCMLLASAWPTQRSQHSHATLKERRKKKKKIMVTKCETVFTVEPRYYHQAIPEKYLIIPSSSRVKWSRVRVQSVSYPSCLPSHTLEISISSRADPAMVPFLGLGLRGRDSHKWEWRLYAHYQLRNGCQPDFLKRLFFFHPRSDFPRPTFLLFRCEPYPSRLGS